MKRIFILLAGIHGQIIRFIIVAACVFAIMYLLPGEARFKYEIQKGKVWLSDNLTAPFDFPVNKSRDEIEAENQEVLKSTHPCFRMNDAVLDKKIQEFAVQFNVRWQDLKASGERVSDRKRKKLEAEKLYQIKTGTELLTGLFNKGIARIPLPFENMPGDYGISLLRDNVAEESQMDDLLTVATAMDYIRAKVPSRADTALLFPLIESLVTENVFYDEALSLRMEKQAIEDISSVRGLVKEGDIIISRGQLVDDEKYKVLVSFKDEYISREGMQGNYYVRAGYFLIVLSSVLVLVVFLSLFRKDVYSDNKKISFIFLLIFLMVFVYTWAVKANLFSLYLVPFCIVPVMVRSLFDTRLALFTHIVIILIAGFLSPNGYEFMFMQTVVGMIAIFSIVNMRNRAQFFIASLYIMIAYAVTYTGISLIHEGAFSDISWASMKWFAGNALLTLFAYPLIFIAEKLFGFISDISLMELSDSNTPLLRELALKAPGTFQHSLQVANLAEAVIREVGGNSLMVRAGALHHDIGKMEMPLYFIENQVTSVNPHDDLSFEESAAIIISHVIRGVETAKKHKLPEQVIDFIRTHHGTTTVQYFYHSYLKNFPDKVSDEEKFKYPGPLPFSRETAVLMMADTVEAASRSLKHHNEESINALVENVIDQQVWQNQFINSNITFRNINTAKKIFKKMLSSIYHARIEYPR